MIGFGTPGTACTDAATPGPVAFAPDFLTLGTHEGRGSCIFSRASSATVKQASNIWVLVGTNIHRVWGGTYAGGVWSADGVATTVHFGVPWYILAGFGGTTTFNRGRSELLSLEEFCSSATLSSSTCDPSTLPP